MIASGAIAPGDVAVFAYCLRIAGPDGESSGDLDLDCETDEEAIRVAARAESPYGHGLWRGEHLLGWFDPRPETEASVS